MLPLLLQTGGSLRHLGVGMSPEETSRLDDDDTLVRIVRFVRSQPADPATAVPLKTADLPINIVARRIQRGQPIVSVTVATSPDSSLELTQEEHVSGGVVLSARRSIA